MKKTIFIFILFPLIINCQSLFNSKPNKYNYTWSLKINTDSSVYIVRSGDLNSYEEYKGLIKKTNDSIYNINVELVFAQSGCRSFSGDSLLYISADSVIRSRFKELKIIYTTASPIIYSLIDKDWFYIPLNKKKFNPDKNKNYIYVSIGHENPITNEEVKTKYYIKTELGLEIYTKSEISFDVLIKKNKLIKVKKNDDIGILYLNKVITK